MTGGSRLLSIGVLVASVVIAGAAHAERPRFEIAPFGGYRIGGDFDLEDEQGLSLSNVDLESDTSWGLGLALYRDPDAYYELLFSRQTTQLDDSDPAFRDVDFTTEYYHFGGTLIFEFEPWIHPYLSVTLGLTRFDADDFGSEYEFSGSLGLGVRIPVSERLSFLLGARGYGTLVDSDTEYLCASAGGEATCLVRSSGDVFFQGEAMLGVALTF
ncbi:MAG: hypothetical protein PVH90_08005 [Gammaproteobacteria bacterium]|jgi:hypothetical protein